MDEKGNVWSGDDGPPNWRYSQIVARCHAAGRPEGHVAFAIQDDGTGKVSVGRTIERAGLDDATVQCIADAIAHAKSPPTLSGTLSGHELPDGGWAPGTGACYVTMY